MKTFLRSIATTFLFSLLFSSGLWAQTSIQPTEGDGSNGDPYQIATLENLIWVRQQTNDGDNWSAGKYFEQTADIDLISIDNWAPIGLDDSEKRFRGNYDGNGYAIRNLKINRPNDDYQGLFGRCDNSTLKNIRLENVVIRGRERVGGLAGRTSGSVENSSVTGTVRGSREYVGGMVGQGSDASLSNRLVFIGKVEGGLDSDTGHGIGGIVGRSSGSTSVSTAYVRGEVNGNLAGGLVGSSSGGASTFSDAYTAVEIGTSRTGQNLGGAVIGRVEASGDNIQNSVYWDTDLFSDAYGSTTSGATLNAIGLSTSQMQGIAAQSNMGNLGFTSPNPWRTVSIPANDYPVFDWQIGAEITLSGKVTAVNKDNISGITVTAQVGDETFKDVTDITDGNGDYSFNVYSEPTRRVFARTTDDNGLPIGAAVEGPWTTNTTINLHLQPRTLTISSGSNNGWVRDGNEILAVEAGAVLNINTLRDLFLAGDVTLVAGVDIVLNEEFKPESSVTHTLTLNAGGKIHLQESARIEINGNIILESDNLDMHSSARLKTDKDLFIRPWSANATIGIAGATGTLQLRASYFTANFESGFANIIIGSDNQTGDINANTFTIRENMTFKSEGNLTIKENIDLNSHTIILDDRIMLNETDGRFFGTTGELTTTRNLNNINDVNVAGLGAILTSEADLGSTTITRTHANQTNVPYYDNSVLRAYNISPANNTGLNATLVYTYNQAELNNLKEADLTLYSSTDNGATFTHKGGTLDANNNTITLTGLDSFSKWTAGQDCANPESGGVIVANPDVVCDGFTTTIQFTESQPVGNYFGILEYQWQMTTTSPTVNFSDWSDLGTNTSTLDITGTITQTTWFRRLVRVECKSVGWEDAVESNTVQISLYPPLAVTAPDGRTKPTCDFTDTFTDPADYQTWFDDAATAMETDFNTWYENATVEFNNNIVGAASPTTSSNRDDFDVKDIFCSGGIISITWTVTDDCGAVSATSAYTLTKPTALSFTDPVGIVTDTCAFDNATSDATQAQTDLTAAIADWVTEQTGIVANSFIGGCSPIVENDFDASDTDFQIALCQGGTITVTWTITDLCETVSRTAAYTLNKPVALSFTDPVGIVTNTCAFDNENSNAAEAQTNLNAAIALWVTEQTGIVSNSFSGGCSPIVENDFDASDSNFQIVLCHGGTITVTWTITDLCETVSRTAAYTLNKPVDMTIETVSDITYSACGPEINNQKELEAAFDTWFNAQTAAINPQNGCSPLVTNNWEQNKTYPYFFTENEEFVTVTWYVDDLCEETKALSATFTFVPGEILTVSNIGTNDEDTRYYCTIQAAIDGAEQGDVIIITPGTYKENVDTKGKKLTLRFVPEITPPSKRAGDGRAIEIVGSMKLNPGDKLEMEIFALDDFDFLEVTDELNLNNATLVITSYQPEPGNIFKIITAGTLKGEFANKSYVATADDKSFVIQYAETPSKDESAVILTSVRRLFKMEIGTSGQE